MNCETYRSKKLSQGVARHFKGALSPLEWPVLGFMFGPLLGDQVPRSTTVIVIEPEPLSGILEFGQAGVRVLVPYFSIPIFFKIISNLGSERRTSNLGSVFNPCKSPSLSLYANSNNSNALSLSPRAAWTEAR